MFAAVEMPILGDLNRGRLAELTLGRNQHLSCFFNSAGAKMPFRFAQEPSHGSHRAVRPDSHDVCGKRLHERGSSGYESVRNFLNNSSARLGVQRWVLLFER